MEVGLAKVGGKETICILFNKAALKKTLITTVINFSVPEVITFLSQTLKKLVSYTGISISQVK